MRGEKGDMEERRGREEDGDGEVGREGVRYR